LEAGDNAWTPGQNPRTWQEALREFLAGAPQFYQEAQDIIQAHLLEFDLGLDHPVVLLEVEADTKLPSNP
jgi:hypothetical protein